jgi:integrase
LFKTPDEKLNPVILSPTQLNFLITNIAFEQSLSTKLQMIKDIFVFGSTVALRWQDLMNLKIENIQFNGENVQIVLHTQKTGTAVNIPLPQYAIDIYKKYAIKGYKYVLPRITGVNFNIHVKVLIKKAGWVYHLPKIRNKKGEQVEIKNAAKNSLRFYEHISAHTMRRTAITTLLMLGVDETSVRRISGHAAGSKEFYKYVGIVQDHLNHQVKHAHDKLLQLQTLKSDVVYAQKQHIM